jgi:hypothetical protein
MRWLETENDMSGRPLVLCTLLGLGVGLTVYYLSNFLNALLSGILTVVFISVLSDYLSSWRVPTEARILAEKAIFAFCESYPDFRVRSVALRAIEVDRFVYSIRYDAQNHTSRPGLRRYFAVTRETDPSVVELDQRDWWPRGLK